MAIDKVEKDAVEKAMTDSFAKEKDELLKLRLEWERLRHLEGKDPDDASIKEEAAAAAAYSSAHSKLCKKIAEANEQPQSPTPTKYSEFKLSTWDSVRLNAGMTILAFFPPIGTAIAGLYALARVADDQYSKYSTRNKISEAQSRSLANATEEVNGFLSSNPELQKTLENAKSQASAKTEPKEPEEAVVEVTGQEKGPEPVENKEASPEIQREIQRLEANSTRLNNQLSEATVRFNAAAQVYRSLLENRPDNMTSLDAQIYEKRIVRADSQCRLPEIDVNCAEAQLKLNEELLQKTLELEKTQQDDPKSEAIKPLKEALQALQDKNSGLSANAQTEATENQNKGKQEISAISAQIRQLLKSRVSAEPKPEAPRKIASGPAAADVNGTKRITMKKPNKPVAVKNIDLPQATRDQHSNAPIPLARLDERLRKAQVQLLNCKNDADMPNLISKVALAKADRDVRAKEINLEGARTRMGQPAASKQITAAESALKVAKESREALARPQTVTPQIAPPGLASVKDTSQKDTSQKNASNSESNTMSK